MERAKRRIPVAQHQIPKQICLALQDPACPTVWVNEDALVKCNDQIKQANVNQKTAARADRKMAPEPEDGHKDTADLALPDVDGLGRGADVLLQRRLPADARYQTPGRARQAGA